MNDPLYRSLEAELAPLRSGYGGGGYLYTLNIVEKHKRRMRPWCDAFKMLVLWRAMMDGCDGDFVLWTDSSRWRDVALLPDSARSAINHLLSHAGDAALPTAHSVYGMAHCISACDRDNDSSDGAEHSHLLRNGHSDRHTELISANVTLPAFRELIDDSPRFSRQPHTLATNVLLENNAFNRRLVWDWLAMLIAKPRAFCSSETQDQAALSILAYNRSLPLLDPCDWLRQMRDANASVDRHGIRYSRSEPCDQQQKDVRFFLSAITRGVTQLPRRHQHRR